MVLISSFPYTINWSQQYIPAILHMAHSSQDEGTALARVLFGDANPGGHLVVTWPKSIDQLPPMMDYDIRHGRTYMYFKGEPLYPFGFGLSYTTFKFSNLRPSATSAAPDATSTSASTSPTPAPAPATKSCSSTSTISTPPSPARQKSSKVSSASRSHPAKPAPSSFRSRSPHSHGGTTD